MWFNARLIVRLVSSTSDRMWTEGTSPGHMPDVELSKCSGGEEDLDDFNDEWVAQSAIIGTKLWDLGMTWTCLPSLWLRMWLTNEWTIIAVILTMTESTEKNVNFSDSCVLHIMAVCCILWLYAAYYSCALHIIAVCCILWLRELQKHKKLFVFLFSYQIPTLLHHS